MATRRLHFWLEWAKWSCLIAIGIISTTFVGNMRRAAAAERTELTATNWDAWVPAGKEVDAIYGDLGLRNEHLVAIIARPIEGRHANMSTREVGGALLDLTRRDRPNDQWTALIPGAGAHRWQGLGNADGHSDHSAPEVTFRCWAAAEAGQPQVELVYRLRDSEPMVRVETTYHNGNPMPVEIKLYDGVRADRSFSFNFVPQHGIFWCHDEWWRQAYAIQVVGGRVPTAVGDTLEKRRPILAYNASDSGDAKVSLDPSASMTLTRYVFPAANELQLRGLISHVAGVKVEPIHLQLQDERGPVANARVEVFRGDESWGFGRTADDGTLDFQAPLGDYRAVVAAAGRAESTFEITVNGPLEKDWMLPSTGWLHGQIHDGHGARIACKVELRGREGTKDPFFGPDTYAYAVHNLIYSAHGQFQQSVPPGHYDVLVSHGPEYDAVTTQIEIVAGQTTELPVTLRRTVETPGWISSDFHSHSTPSGDNTSSTLGRVLNLLAEHIEFAPCTEHNRITTYAAELEMLDATRQLATCAGMELTGAPLPVNHQNAFPLVHKPRTQSGGGPDRDENPVVQIERLAFWDRQAAKVVQGNHPNLMQILGDRDVDGKPDGGFERMLHAMDVVEVHPPASILEFPTAPPPRDEPGNVIFDWLRLLNQGYRIPGVVNTDAHYNFHGSGWLRNFIKSPVDDPAEVNVAEMVRAAERGQIVMSNGPFLSVVLSNRQDSTLGAAGPGDDLVCDSGECFAHLRVQCANWLDINRILVFVNGRPQYDLRRTALESGFAGGVVKFARTLPLKISADAHVIVVAAGEGLRLGPVVGPDHQNDIPIAVANPIFVDLHGDGFLPNGDSLDLPLPLP